MSKNNNNFQEIYEPAEGIYGFKNFQYCIKVKSYRLCKNIKLGKAKGK
jgi:hypothetical protein